MPDSNDIINDPEWYPHEFDQANNRILFIRLPIKERENLTFLAEAPVDEGRNKQWVTADSLLSAEIKNSPVHFIFHSAFCRSTLLVQAFGALPATIGQSEPKILNTFASVARDKQFNSLLPAIIRLLGRPVEGETSVVVKPSNVANALIPALMNCNEESKGIIIHSNLRGFLRSIAKKGLHGRIWGRRLMAHNSRHIPLNLGLDTNAQFELSDMQAAAIAWLLHQWQFRHVLSQFPGRLFSLDSDQFIAMKSESLREGAKQFGIDVSRDEISTIAESKLFSTHAKLGGDFSRTMADQERRVSSEIIDEEIEQVAYWIEVIQGQLNLTLPHASPLID